MTEIILNEEKFSSLTREFSLAIKIYKLMYKKIQLVVKDYKSFLVKDENGEIISQWNYLEKFGWNEEDVKKFLKLLE